MDGKEYASVIPGLADNRFRPLSHTAHETRSWGFLCRPLLCIHPDTLGGCRTVSWRSREITTRSTVPCFALCRTSAENLSRDPKDHSGGPARHMLAPSRPHWSSLLSFWSEFGNHADTPRAIVTSRIPCHVFEMRVTWATAGGGIR